MPFSPHITLANKVLTFYIFYRWAHSLNNLPKVTYVVSDAVMMWSQVVSDSTISTRLIIILYTVSLLKSNLERFLSILSFQMKSPVGIKVGQIKQLLDDSLEITGKIIYLYFMTS